MSDVTDREPDFYMYGGDGNQHVLGVLRRCTRLKYVDCGGERVLLVRIEPPIEPSALTKGARLDVVGLSNRSSTSPLDRLDHLQVVGAIVWAVYELAGDDCKASPEIGIVGLFRDEPLIKPDGGAVVTDPSPESIARNVTA